MRIYIPDSRSLSNDQLVTLRETYKKALSDLSLTGKSKHDLNRRFRPQLEQTKKSGKKYNPSTNNRGRNYMTYRI